MMRCVRTLGRVVSLGAVLGVGLTGTVSSAAAQAVVPVPQLDLKQFAGVWYEAMHTPEKWEKKCLHETTVLYGTEYKADQFSVVRTCLVSNDISEVKNGDGRRASKKSTNGALKVRTIWPFYDRYNVIALGPNYEWAVVGSANHKKLRFLARAKVPAAETLTEMKQRATAQGFDVTRLLAPPAS